MNLLEIQFNKKKYRETYISAFGDIDRQQFDFCANANVTYFCCRVKANIYTTLFM